MHELEGITKVNKSIPNRTKEDLHIPKNNRRSIDDIRDKEFLEQYMQKGGSVKVYDRDMNMTLKYTL